MKEAMEEFVENTQFTKRELLVLKIVKEVNEELDQDENAIMKELVENSEIDQKALHDGWRKLVPKGLMRREEVKTSSRLHLTKRGETVLELLEPLDIAMRTNFGDEPTE